MARESKYLTLSIDMEHKELLNLVITNNKELTGISKSFSGMVKKLIIAKVIEIKRVKNDS